MKFFIESVTKCSGRLGLITALERLPEKSFKTPLLLLTDHNLSKEVLDIAGFRNFAVLLPLDSIEQMRNPLKVFQKGISEFIGLKECLTFVTIKNPSVTSPSGHHEKGFISIFKKSGKLNVSANDYMTFIEAANPDFFVTLADGDTWIDCSKKRVSKSNERSEEMFDECLKHHKESLAGKSCRLLASVEGGYNEFERQKTTDYIKDFDENISGYFIDGFHRNGSEAVTLDLEKVSKIVKSTLSNLPENKMKIMLGAYMPHHVMELVSLGIDVFDSSFAILAMRMNRALTFNFDLKNPTKREAEIDLMDVAFKEDFTSFLDTCECLACSQHTKAYTNHLLVTRELLGPMLLTIHNLHHYSRFFEAIQESIKEDKLKDLTELIQSQYQNSLFSYDPPVAEKPQK